VVSHAGSRLPADLAEMLADGGHAIADLAVLRDQPAVCGPVAFASNAWHLLAGIGSGVGVFRGGFEPAQYGTGPRRTRPETGSALASHNCALNCWRRRTTWAAG
jgi:hypothetical protein